MIVCMSLSKLGLPGLRTASSSRGGDHPDRIQDDFRVQPRPRGHGTGPRARPRQEWGNNADQPGDRSSVLRGQGKTGRRSVATRIGRAAFCHPQTRGCPFSLALVRGLPISTKELYERLKKKGVLVVSGHYFFPGLEENWPHKNECVRVTYAQDDEVVEKGLSMIASEIREIHSQS